MGGEERVGRQEVVVDEIVEGAVWRRRGPVEALSSKAHGVQRYIWLAV